jgi:uncharacterized protein
MSHAMTKPTFPGVYVEEVSTGVKSIEGVSTSTAAFLGVGHHGLDPVLVTSFAEFLEAFGPSAAGCLPLAVRGFFENGGRRCWVVSVPKGESIHAGLEALEREEFSIFCCPDEHDCPGATGRILSFAERLQRVIALLQLPARLAGPVQVPEPRSSYVACYAPWLVVRTLDGTAKTLTPPGGHVAGVYARLAIERGIHHPPDGVRVTDVLGLAEHIDEDEAEAMAAQGVNLVRDVPDRGMVLRGARTTSEDAVLQHVAVRRLLIFVEQSIVRGLQWTIFEPNGPVLWINVRRAIEDFLLNLWHSGVLVGLKPEQACFVRCDRSTMTQDDIDNGRFIALVGLATIRPAEFVILRFMGQTVRRPEDD